MRIEQLMSQPAITCSARDTLNTAARLMWENDCGILPVVDDDGHLTGVITDRDICMAAYTQGKALSELPISDAMARQVFACHPGDSVDAAEQIMSERQVRRVPVINDGGHPVGVLSLNDIARDAAGAREANGVRGKLVQTLAAICRPRPRQALATQQHSAAPPPM